jgi:hypothetical protein
MTLYPSNQRPPDEAIFPALGRLVYAFTQLEAALLHALVTALGETDEARVVVLGLTFNQALDRFSVLYSGLQGAGDVKELCSTLASLNQERNQHIHGSWGFWESGAPARIRQRLKRHQGISLAAETVKPQELILLAGRMNQAMETVYELRRLSIDQRHQYRSVESG